MDKGRLHNLRLLRGSSSPNGLIWAIVIIIVAVVERMARVHGAIGSIGATCARSIAPGTMGRGRCGARGGMRSDLHWITRGMLMRGSRGGHGREEDRKVASLSRSMSCDSGSKGNFGRRIDETAHVAR